MKPLFSLSLYELIRRSCMRVPYTCFSSRLRWQPENSLCEILEEVLLSQAPLLRPRDRGRHWLQKVIILHLVQTIADIWRDSVHEINKRHSLGDGRIDNDAYAEDIHYVTSFPSDVRDLCEVLDCVLLCVEGLRIVLNSTNGPYWRI